MGQIFCSSTFSISRKASTRTTALGNGLRTEYLENYTSYFWGITAMQLSLIKPVTAPASCASLCSVHNSGLHPKSRCDPVIANDVKGRSLGTGKGHNRMPFLGANFSDVTKLRLIQEIL